MRSTPILRPLLGTALLLCIPLVAMQFTDEVNWTASDLIVMGALLVITGVTLEFAARRAGRYRVAAALVIVAAFLWLWVELAVGLFTNWGS